MQALIAPALAALASVLTSMLMKLIGYEFISRIVIIGLSEWAKTTQTTLDDKIYAEAAKAFGVPEDLIKK